MGKMEVSGGMWAGRSKILHRIVHKMTTSLIRLYKSRWHKSIGLKVEKWDFWVFFGPFCK